MSDPGARPAKRLPSLVKVSETWGHVRLAVQVAAFLLFLFLLFGIQQEMKTGSLHGLFFMVDPLVGFSATIAGRALIVPMLIGGLVLLAATLVFGRAWCGWVCPLGSLFDWIPARRARENESDIHPSWRHGKDFTLFMIVLGAVLGSLTLIVLDPVTMLFRALAAVVVPLLNSALLIVDTWLYSFGPLQSTVGWFDSSVRAPLLGDYGLFLPNLTLLALLTGVLALNAVRRRFWCRYLCPLGALLGLVSRISLVRHRIDRDNCISCGRCATRCPTHAIDPERHYVAQTAECVSCLDCVENCPTRAIAFSTGGQINLGYQPERRRFVQSIGLAAIGAVVLAFLPTPARKVQTLIRPPGSSEDSLADKCIRCGECVKVCPTSSIQPAVSAPGWDKTWSPHLVMRRGYCDYSCNACGRVCPTGAIAALTLEKKRKEVIGVAAIDRKRCIPFDEDRECIVCEEMCPLPQKAVTLRTEPGHRAARPHVLAEVCTGCGICEKQCPVAGEAAIRILPPGTVSADPEEAESIVESGGAGATTS